MDHSPTGRISMDSETSVGRAFAIDKTSWNMQRIQTKQQLSLEAWLHYFILDCKAKNLSPLTLRFYQYSAPNKRIWESISSTCCNLGQYPKLPSEHLPEKNGNCRQTKRRCLYSVFRVLIPFKMTTTLL